MQDQFGDWRMDKFEAAGLYSGLGLIWLLLLGISVIRGRQTKQIGLGDGGDAQMERLVRAHANASEWLPPGLITLWGLALLPAAPVWLLHAGAAPLLIGRLLHGFGLSKSSGASAPRVIGMILTMTAFVILGAGLIWAALSAAFV